MVLKLHDFFRILRDIYEDLQTKSNYLQQC